MKNTVGDKILNFYESYLKVSKSKVGKKEKRLLDPKEYDEVLHPDDYSKLTPEKRRKIALMSPLLMKGMKKKSMDTFRAWFELETADTRNKPPKADVDIIRDFETRSQIKKKLYHARLCAHIYGDGFLLITFTNDESKSLSDPIDDDATPWNLDLINSEKITEMKVVNGQTYYVYQDGNQMELKLIHPDRLLHFTIDKLPHSNFGVSTIDILRWTLESNKNVDKATGAILSWFSHGILDLTKVGLGDIERDKLLQIAAKHPGAWVHDEDVSVEYKNPTAIDPKPFYDYIVLNIAAVLNMPTHVLTGIQTGRVTGSEIGFSDYYRDVRDEQQLVFEPSLEKLYTRILESQGRTWKYVFKWNEIYVDEGMEVEQLSKKMTAAEVGIRNGIITKEEARRIINDGQIQLQPDDLSGLEDKKEEKTKPDIKEKERYSDPPRKPRDGREPHRPSFNDQFSEEEIAMIKRCRAAKEKAQKELAEKERKLGEAILNEDNDNATDSD